MYVNQGSFAKVMQPDAGVEAEVDECLVDPEAQDSTKKLNWPELQKDSAPSALLVPAKRCLARQMKKNEELLKRFTDAPVESLTELQKQPGS